MSRFEILKNAFKISKCSRKITFFSRKYFYILNQCDWSLIQNYIKLTYFKNCDNFIASKLWRYTILFTESDYNQYSLYTITDLWINFVLEKLIMKIQNDTYEIVNTNQSVFFDMYIEPLKARDTHTEIVVWKYCDNGRKGRLFIFALLPA